eukprot:4649660-Alexandrium_andersonii.AAC.1
MAARRCSSDRSGGGSELRSACSPPPNGFVPAPGAAVEPAKLGGAWIPNCLSCASSKVSGLAPFAFGPPDDKDSTTRDS